VRGPTPRQRRLAQVALALALAPLALYALPQLGGGDQAYTVLSGSMVPAFHPGDFIVSARFQRGDPVEAGDVLTYREGRVLVTHRVLEVHGEPGWRRFVTQGDNNAAPDPGMVPENLVVAKYLYHVPAYGHLLLFATQPLGRFLFIVVPAGCVLVLEVRKLLRLAKEADAAERAKAQGLPGASASEPVPRPAPEPAASPPALPAAVVVLRRRAPNPRASAAGVAAAGPPGAPVPPAQAFVVVRRGLP
jgi:signal peptidase I